MIIKVLLHGKESIIKRGKESFAPWFSLEEDKRSW
jgi:hypothetical protein